ncbi:endo-1,4-beta-xylanase [Neptunicella marina]|uniref:Beta-xylanase n=1 Tax=Neptunicella marina TaxID=2125989 RepID=A0A8J6M1H6_9ALTE|nr:endo-1,4-beta-xylanase [Neptunicella marina]MBC3765488.1 endo-1,4-beta-xylanase [Neptunicella marina]
MSKFIKLASLLALSAISACSQQQPSASNQPLKQQSLKQKYQDYFYVGAAADQNSYIDHAELLKTHFSSMTTENEMKFESLEPSQNQFDFALADKMVAFAKSNQMQMRGHALVWHRQTPQWVFFDETDNKRSKDQVLAIMKNHIDNVVGHFKGKVDYWDVVNEAIMDDGSMRTENESADDQKSWWYGTIGKDYIAAAFHYAHAADPNAKLYYNDYYNYIPARQQAIYDLLKSLLEQGVPIDGVGLQAHLNTIPSDDPNHQSYYQSIENLEKAIQLYASLGLDVQITELDVSLYIGGHKYEKSDFYTADTIPAELDEKQAQRYADLFAMFRRNSQHISNVTFWGIADDNTWLSEFDSGREDFPMLFDVKHQPKSAFNAVMDF